MLILHSHKLDESQCRTGGIIATPFSVQNQADSNNTAILRQKVQGRRFGLWIFESHPDENSMKIRRDVDENSIEIAWNYTKTILKTYVYIYIRLTFAQAERYGQMKEHARASNEP
jgi:hypothetical protein